MKKSRTENSILNSSISMITYIISIVIAFISQTLFVKLMGKEYLGINGLFSNILTMLSLFELGIGNAIIYNLYKPIYDNNIEKIKSLLNFYKKAYLLIAIIVSIVGCVLIPILPFFIKKITIDVNITIVYLLMLSSTVSSYILSYKRSILYASQKNYILNISHCIYLIILNSLQILILILTKSFYLYLSLKTICQLIENLIITIICNNKYPFLKDKAKKLDKNTEKEILNKVKALFFHQIGTVLVYGTDNVIISKFLGIMYVGLYSNYSLIINSIINSISKFFSSITSSVGNLLIECDDNKNFRTFKNIRFINFWISCFSACIILLVVQPFIRIWLGSDFLLDNIIVVILVLNYFQIVQRNSYIIFKNSAGIWEPDKYIPIIEAILNIFSSIVLVYKFGLIGVFCGTIISSLVIWLYSYPKYVYMKLFNKKYLQYIKDNIIQLLLFGFICITSVTFCYFINILINKDDSNIIKLIVNLIVSIIICNSILILIFKNREEFKFFKLIFNKILKKFKIILKGGKIK